MPYVSADAIQQAREMDLLTYLQTYEPGELVHVSGNTYCTREHDSLKISNGKWCWFSRSIGGKSALDYLMKVKNYSLPEAVEAIAGHGAVQPSISYKPKQDRHCALLMPELMERPSQAAAYLRSRGIHPKVIEYCIENNLLFETVKYHNAVFVGYGNDGKAKYAAMRGTLGNYKGEVTGSDKHYSFKINGDPQNCNAILTTTDKNNGTEVVTITPEKKQMIKDLFWQMTSFSTFTETKTETEIQIPSPQPN